MRKELEKEVGGEWYCGIRVTMSMNKFSFRTYYSEFIRLVFERNSTDYEIYVAKITEDGQMNFI